MGYWIHLVGAVITAGIAGNEIALRTLANPKRDGESWFVAALGVIGSIVAWPAALPLAWTVRRHRLAAEARQQALLREREVKEAIRFLEAQAAAKGKSE